MEKPVAQERFKALVHYLIAESSGNPGDLGSVRLNKALWFSDVFAYQMEGKSITGSRYVKRERGPVPEYILATIEQLRDEGKIWFERPRFPFDSWKYSSRVAPDTSLFSERHLGYAGEALEFVTKKTANEVSEMTHDEIWKAASEGEEIPLFATLASGWAELTDEIVEWAGTIIRDKRLIEEGELA